MTPTAAAYNLIHLPKLLARRQEADQYDALSNGGGLEGNQERWREA